MGRAVAYAKRRVALGRRLSRLLPVGACVRWQHELAHGAPPDLRRPASLNEKVAWLKLREPEPGARECSDKLLVRRHVEARCGPGILNELLGVYRRVEEIDPAALPKAFVLKPTHTSGSNVICPDRAALDWPAARARLRKALARDYYWVGREPAYRGLPRRIVCEAYLGEPGAELPDYKFFCFHGEPRLVQVDTGRFVDHRRELFDLDWCPLPFCLEHPLPDRPTPRPTRLAELVGCARRLAAGFRLVRVDLYQVGERVVFGELTFTPGGGRERFHPPSADREVGALLRLEEPPGG
jgi:hypothetical protein